MGSAGDLSRRGLGLPAVHAEFTEVGEGPRSHPGLRRVPTSRSERDLPIGPSEDVMSGSFRKAHARKISWFGQIVAAAILGVALPGKFLADPAAVGVFQQLGAEPLGRWATGGFEAIAVVLLLVPVTAVYGGLLTAGLMVGAILSHLAVLGVAPDGDPSMFVMAVVAFLAGAGVAWIRRCELPLIGARGGSCDPSDSTSA